MPQLGENTMHELDEIVGGGINVDQLKAFLRLKTKQMQQQNNNQFVLGGYDTSFDIDVDMIRLPAKPQQQQQPQPQPQPIAYNRYSVIESQPQPELLHAPTHENMPPQPSHSVSPVPPLVGVLESPRVICSDRLRRSTFVARHAQNCGRRDLQKEFDDATAGTSISLNSYDFLPQVSSTPGQQIHHAMQSELEFNTAAAAAKKRFANLERSFEENLINNMPMSTWQPALPGTSQLPEQRPISNSSMAGRSSYAALNGSPRVRVRRISELTSRATLAPESEYIVSATEQPVAMQLANLTAQIEASVNPGETISDDEDTDELEFSTPPLNLAPVASTNQKKTWQLPVPYPLHTNDSSNVLLDLHRTHTMSLRNCGPQKPVPAALNKPPSHAINGEQFAEELARMTYNQILDLRMRNSQGQLRQSIDQQWAIEQSIQSEMLRRNLNDATVDLPRQLIMSSQDSVVSSLAMVGSPSETNFMPPPTNGLRSSLRNARHARPQQEPSIQQQRNRLRSNRRAAPMTQELKNYMKLSETMAERLKRSSGTKRSLYTKGDSGDEDNLLEPPAKQPRLSYSSIEIAPAPPPVTYISNDGFVMPIGPAPPPVMYISNDVPPPATYISNVGGDIPIGFAPAPTTCISNVGGDIPIGFAPPPATYSSNDGVDVLSAPAPPPRTFCNNISNISIAPAPPPPTYGANIIRDISIAPAQPPPTCGANILSNIMIAPAPRSTTNSSNMISNIRIAPPPPSTSDSNNMISNIRIAPPPPPTSDSNNMISNIRIAPPPPSTSDSNNMISNIRIAPAPPSTTNSNNMISNIRIAPPPPSTSDSNSMISNIRIAPPPPSTSDSNNMISNIRIAPAPPSTTNSNNMISNIRIAPPPPSTSDSNSMISNIRIAPPPPSTSDSNNMISNIRIAPAPPSTTNSSNTISNIRIAPAPPSTSDSNNMISNIRIAPAPPSTTNSSNTISNIRIALASPSTSDSNSMISNIRIAPPPHSTFDSNNMISNIRIAPAPPSTTNSSNTISNIRIAPAPPSTSDSSNMTSNIMIAPSPPQNTYSGDDIPIVPPPPASIRYSQSAPQLKGSACRFDDVDPFAEPSLYMEEVPALVEEEEEGAVQQARVAQQNVEQEAAAPQFETASDLDSLHMDELRMHMITPPPEQTILDEQPSTSRAAREALQLSLSRQQRMAERANQQKNKEQQKEKQSEEHKDMQKVNQREKQKEKQSEEQKDEQKENQSEEHKDKQKKKQRGKQQNGQVEKQMEKEKEKQEKNKKQVTKQMEKQKYKQKQKQQEKQMETEMQKESQREKQHEKRKAPQNSKTYKSKLQRALYKIQITLPNDTLPPDTTDDSDAAGIRRSKRGNVPLQNTWCHTLKDPFAFMRRSEISKSETHSKKDCTTARKRKRVHLREQQQDVELITMGSDPEPEPERDPEPEPQSTARKRKRVHLREQQQDVDLITTGSEPEPEPEQEPEPEPEPLNLSLHETSDEREAVQQTKKQAQTKKRVGKNKTKDTQPKPVPNPASQSEPEPELMQTKRKAQTKKRVGKKKTPVTEPETEPMSLSPNETPVPNENVANLESVPVLEPAHNSESVPTGNQPQEQFNKLMAWLRCKSAVPPRSHYGSNYQTDSMYITPASRLAFSQLEGLEYAFYDTQENCSLGLIRFQPLQQRGLKPNKANMLYFIVLFGQFDVESCQVDSNEMQKCILYPGDMLEIKAGTHFNITNRLNEVSILMVNRK